MKKLLLAIMTLALGSCTEDSLVGVDPTTRPGPTSETVELSVDVTELPLWMDTTYVGYAVPFSSAIQLLANEPALMARILGRFSTLPDSIFVETARVAVERFESARVRLIVDTLAGPVLPESGTELRFHALTRGFDEREASWAEARVGEAWTTPGGDLGDLLGSVSVDSIQDTLFVPITVDSDSLLSAWLATDGEMGYAVSSSAEGTNLTLSSIALVFDVKPEGQDTLIEVVRGPQPFTFIFSPETPSPGRELRLGGLPAARIYLRFELPDTLTGVPLRGSRINRASLILRSLGGPPAPFTTTDTLFASLFDVLADPFEFGPKTPIGLNFGNFLELDPDSLASGGEQELNITALIQNWASASADSLPDLRIGIRALPEGGGVGYWEFGDVDDPVAAPRLVMLVTPPADFTVP
ncbi:MAG: hypothetical protein OEM96_05455 [Gemmatimonadota bacterium]|nr:hypothetical protein [Gemmatimonadota bacterium]